ncbi:MAG: CoA transferase [Rhodospirillaceae bacterium]|nr:CoA transferase [Rhodospirillaceae bacterium]
MPPSRTGPLSHIRVIEFCQVAAGPYCGMLLADMGADVIKVEPPAGDTMRAWPPLTGGYSENFASLNRNKRSIVLDLKTPADLETARRLILSADVVIENNRPGVMDKLGLGHAQFKTTHPKLIYCSISAFGQTGPRAEDGGFDVTVQAASGIMSVTGEEGAAPVKAGVPVSDFGAGLYAAFSIVAQLNAVTRGADGVNIDVSMLGANLGVSALQTSEYFGTGKNPKPLGSAHPRNAPYRAFKCQDGYFVLAAGNDKLWRGVCEVIARPDLPKDARFLTTLDRAKNQAALKDILETIFAAHPVAHWVPAFRKLGVPCEPIMKYEDVLADDQVRHMDWVKDITLPSGAVTKTVGPVVAVAGAPAGIYRNPPGLGADRDEILAELAKLGQ